MSVPDAVVWHDLECGSYDADLPLWLALATESPGPVLDVGAGTGRVALPLARAGHAVVALDRDPVLLAALRRRGGGLPITCVHADACSFSLAEPVGLCIVPMQTIHLLLDRPGFLRSARACLAGGGGLLAVALLGEGVEPFEKELEPERCEIDGVRYASQPTAVRVSSGEIVLERRRRRHGGGRAGGTLVEDDVVRLAPLDAATLALEAAAAGFALKGARAVEATEDRAGSLVAIFVAAAAARPMVDAG